MADDNDTERDDAEETKDDADERADVDARADGDNRDSAGESDDGDSDDGDSDDGDSGAAASKSDDDAGDARSDDDLSRRERSEAEAAQREAAEDAEHPAASSITSLLGIERWVQFAFIVIGVVLFFLADNMVRFVWGMVGEPDGGIVSAVAAVSSVLGAFALYRHTVVNQLATEVITELRDVTWPTRDEVYYSTIVVIVTSIVAATYTGALDAFWSFVTNQVYG